VLVAFEAEKQTKLALVPVSARGLQFGALHDKLGLRACPSADLDLRGVEVPATECFTPQGGLAAARALALRLVGAIATGNGRGAIARGIAYASDRIQGGDRIIRHGIIQSLLGEAELALAAAEAWIARVPDEDGDLAKVVGTRAGEQAALDAVQVHGGYGYMRDYKVEKCLRDAKMLSLIGGDNRRLVQSNFERRVLAQVVP
jgi:alkylation response protein AidB-like acyl-CoA dehydrogenase